MIYDVAGSRPDLDACPYGEDKRGGGRARAFTFLINILSLVRHRSPPPSFLQERPFNSHRRLFVRSVSISKDTHSVVAVVVVVVGSEVIVPKDRLFNRCVAIRSSFLFISSYMCIHFCSHIFVNKLYNYEVKLDFTSLLFGIRNIILELQLFSVPHEHSKSSHALQTLIELNASNRVSSSIRKKSIVETLNRLRFKRAARINPIRGFLEGVDLDA